jgi:hypothetical protein
LPGACDAPRLFLFPSFHHVGRSRQKTSGPLSRVTVSGVQRPFAIRWGSAQANDVALSPRGLRLGSKVLACLDVRRLRRRVCRLVGRRRLRSRMSSKNSLAGD